MVKKILAKCFVYLILLLMYAPILVLIVFSFTTARSLGEWDGFSFKLYLELFNDEKIMTAVWNTLLVALCSAIVATIIGTLGSIGTFYSKKRMKGAIKSVEQVQIATPEIVIALSLTILFVAIGLKFNFITLLIGHVVLTIPFVVLSIAPRLKQMDPNLYEAAIDLGASPTQALWKVIIPEILPGILSGFMLSITLSLDDYIITAFTRNDTFDTLSTYIQGVIVKSGLPASLRALTTILFMVVLATALLINYNKSKKKGRR
jgi:spermidine/putrescine transport system permease protein